MRVARVPLLVLALAALGLTGCASVDPTGSFESTRELVAGRHPGTVHWQRGDQADAVATARAAELLAVPITPDSGAEIALIRNPELQGTLEGLGIAQAELAQASRLSNPGVSFSRLSGSGELQRTVAISADLVDWLVQPLRRRLAEAELERTRLEVGDALLGVVADARSAVVTYQAANQLLARLERIEAIDRSAADYAKALFDAGNLTALERANAEAAWAESQAEVGRARLDIVRLREAASLTLGLDPSDAWQVASELPLPPDATFDSKMLEERAVADRLDLVAARWAVDAIERALALKRKTRYVPVGVEVGVERERETDGINLTGPTVELRLPLFDTGKASIALLEAELARSNWQLRALEAQVRSSVRERGAELAANRELVTLYIETILPLRKEVLQRTLLEYNQMLVGTFDLLLAKQEEVDAERRALEALSGYWLARVALERAVGSPLPESEHGHHHDHSAAPSGGSEENR